MQTRAVRLRSGEDLGLLPVADVASRMRTRPPGGGRGYQLAGLVIVPTLSLIVAGNLLCLR